MHSILYMEFPCICIFLSSKWICHLVEFLSTISDANVRFCTVSIVDIHINRKHILKEKAWCIVLLIHTNLIRYLPALLRMRGKVKRIGWRTRWDEKISEYLFQIHKYVYIIGKVNNVSKFLH